MLDGSAEQILYLVAWLAVRSYLFGSHLGVAVEWALFLDAQYRFAGNVGGTAPAAELLLNHANCCMIWGGWSSSEIPASLTSISPSPGLSLEGRGTCFANRSACAARARLTRARISREASAGLD